MCSTTEEGVWCFEYLITWLAATNSQLRAVQASCNDEIGCSPTCKNEFLKVKSLLGCCVSMMINNTFVKAVFSDYTADALVAKSEVWAKCEVTQPQDCDIQYYNGKGNSMHASGTALLTVIIMNSVM